LLLPLLMQNAVPVLKEYVVAWLSGLVSKQGSALISCTTGPGNAATCAVAVVGVHCQ